MGDDWTGITAAQEITTVDLGQALAEIPVEIDNRTPGCPVFIGWLRNPEDLAKRALAVLDSKPGERTEPDLCAQCGNQFLPGQVCRDCERRRFREAVKQPIVLHMGDPELPAIGCILAALEDLDAEAVERVLAYVTHRLT